MKQEASPDRAGSESQTPQKEAQMTSLVFMLNMLGEN
jgi:hypothetical protein